MLSRSNSQEQCVTGVTNLLHVSERDVFGYLGVRTHQEVEELDERLPLPLRGECNSSVIINANKTEGIHPYQLDLSPNVPTVRLISTYVFSGYPTSKSNVVTGQYSVMRPARQDGLETHRGPR